MYYCCPIQYLHNNNSINESRLTILIHTASLSTFHAVHAFHPDIIINAGTAGGFKKVGAAIGYVMIILHVIRWMNHHHHYNYNYFSYLHCSSPSSSFFSSSTSSSLSLTLIIIIVIFFFFIPYPILLVMLSSAQLSVSTIAESLFQAFKSTA